MPEPTVLVTDLAFGLLLGCVFAVIAHGLNLIWGVAKVVNVAHGEFIMLGAYGAYFLNLWFGFNPLLSAPVDAAIGLGVGVDYGLFIGTPGRIVAQACAAPGPTLPGAASKRTREPSGDQTGELPRASSRSPFPSAPTRRMDSIGP